MENLMGLHEELYEAGARNFLFIDVPPIDRSPAGMCRTQKIILADVNSANWLLFNTRESL